LTEGFGRGGAAAEALAAGVGARCGSHPGVSQRPSASVPAKQVR